MPTIAEPNKRPAPDGDVPQNDIAGLSLTIVLAVAIVTKANAANASAPSVGFSRYFTEPRKQTVAPMYIAYAAGTWK